MTDPDETVEPPQPAKVLILERLAEGSCDAETLAAHAGVTCSRVSRVMGELIPSGEVEMVGKVGCRKLYALVGAQQGIACPTS